MFSSFYFWDCVNSGKLCSIRRFESSGPWSVTDLVLFPPDLAAKVCSNKSNLWPVAQHLNPITFTSSGKLIRPSISSRLWYSAQNRHTASKTKEHKLLHDISTTAPKLKTFVLITLFQSNNSAIRKTEVLPKHVLMNFRPFTRIFYETKWKWRCLDY